MKALDGNGNVYQIEVQLQSRNWTPIRMVLTLCQTWFNQIEQGRPYNEVGEVYSIWLLRESLWPGDGDLCFRMCCPEKGLELIPHFKIHVWQLREISGNAKIDSDKARWQNFFRNGKDLDPDNLPEGMDTIIMRQAMAVLNRFRNNPEARYAYECRMRYLSEIGAYEVDRRKDKKRLEEAEKTLAEERASRKQAEERHQQAEAERKQAQAERELAAQKLEQALELLRRNGIAPDAP